MPSLESGIELHLERLFVEFVMKPYMENLFYRIPKILAMLIREFTVLFH